MASKTKKPKVTNNQTTIGAFFKPKNGTLKETESLSAAAATSRSADALEPAIEEALFVPEKRSPEDDEQSSSEEPDAEIVTKGRKRLRKGASKQSDSETAGALSTTNVTVTEETERKEDAGEVTETKTTEVEVETPSGFFSQTKKEKKVTDAEEKLMSEAAWKEGERVPYAAVAQVFSRIEVITGRLEIQSIVTNFFRQVIRLSPDDLLPAVYLCCNKFAPACEGVEIGIGDSLLIKAIVESAGKSAAIVKQEYEEVGDLGIVAERAKKKQTTLFNFKPAPLTMRKVWETLLAIAKETGGQSQARKVGIIKQLLVAAEGPEARYIVRALQGKLRIGLAEQSVLTSLAHAFVLKDNKKKLPEGEMQKLLSAAEGTVKQVYSECPNYAELVPALLELGLDRVHERCHLKAGSPVQPMLAKPTKGISAILDRFQGLAFTSEYKYDGERAQIHITDDGTVKIYSRNMEDHTGKYPDLINYMTQHKWEKVKSAVVDCEVVAFDREQQKLLPFQVLSTRSRKAHHISLFKPKDVTQENIKVQVILFAFDLLYLNGESLLRKTFRERRSLLQSNLSEEEGKFQFATGQDATEIDSIQSFLEQSIKDNCEGLMLKTLDKDAFYTPSRRTFSWLKLKKDYLDGFGDSLDLVPIGAYHGRGKRTGTYGAYLLACYNEDAEEYQTVCKIGTGLSDVQLKEFSDLLRDQVASAPPSYYSFSEALQPDVWFMPNQVWEIKCADLSISPNHTAAMGILAPDKGIALRFPRFLRIREDKKPEEATTGTQVAEFYRAQGLHQQNQQDDANDEL